MLIYNSGRASGCSRSHKHMQLLPRPPRTSFSLFPDLPPDTPANMPYVYDLIRHPPSLSSSMYDDPHTPTYIITSYTSSLNRLRSLLDIQRDDEPVPHNVIMTREWTVVIPRRTARVNGLGVNAAGMMGLVWVTTEEEMEECKRSGAWRMLGEFGFKAGKDGQGENNRMGIEVENNLKK